MCPCLWPVSRWHDHHRVTSETIITWRDPLIGHDHQAFWLADTRLYWDGNGLSNLAKLNTILILTRMMIFRLLLSGELSRGRDNYTESRSLSNEGLSLVRSSWCLPLIGRHPLIILTPIMWPPYSHLVTTQTGFTSDKIIPQHFPCLVIILPDRTPPSVSKLCKETNLLYIQARGRR